MKTTQPDGIIIYSGGATGKDFMALELVGGQLRYLYDVGSSPRVVQVSVRHAVSDNRWHDVAILHPSLTEYILRVDNVSKLDVLPDSRSVHFDMGEELYIGGAPRALFAVMSRQVRSKDGFQGCLASVDLDGDSRSLHEQGVDVPAEFSEQIRDGCEGESSMIFASILKL